MKQELTFALTIAHVSELLYSGNAHSVTVPGSEGELTLLPQHEPLISALKKGTITVRDAGEPRTFSIERGILETSNGQVTILV